MKYGWPTLRGVVCMRHAISGLSGRQASKTRHVTQIRLLYRFFVCQETIRQVVSSVNPDNGFNREV